MSSELNVKLFTPHIGQKRIIDGFVNSEHKFGIVSTGRQFGKSLLAQNLLLYWLLRNNKSKGAWISPVYMQCTKVFKELLAASRPLIKSHNKSELSIEFLNGSTLKFLSADNYDNIRGFSFEYMVIDEAAFIKSEAITEAILPTLTVTGKKCLIISTPKGKNWFYNYWLQGSNPNPIYTSFKGISIDNPYVNKEFIEEQRKSLPTEVFAQEYLAEFSDSGNDVFKNLHNVCTINSFTLTNEKVVCGIDVGLQSDYSVLSILTLSGDTVEIKRVNNKSLTDIADEFTNVLKRYNCVSGYIEVNGLGRGLYEMMLKNFKWLKPFTTTQDSKTQSIRLLIGDIEDSKIQLPSEKLMPELIREFSSYTYKLSNNGKLSFSHPSGYHDDIVDSIWLANTARHEPTPSQSLYIGGKKRY